MSKTSIQIDGLWMRTKAGCPLGTVEVLIRHEGQWKLAFGDGPSPQAYAVDQEVDHVIHPTGLQHVIERSPADARGQPVPPYDAHVQRSYTTRLPRERRRR